MARTKPIQSSFSAGELSPDLELRRDTQQYSDGARSLLNNRLLISGGAKRRPGTRYVADLPGNARLEEFVVNGDTQYLLAFSAGRLDAFLPDGTPAGFLTGCPWGVSVFQTMGCAQSGNAAILTHPTMAPQILQRTGVDTWVVEPFAFFSDYGLRINQPYYKLAPSGMTMKPSALTGSGVTLTLSGPWWSSGHVGQRVRYLGREIYINSVSSPTVAVGNILETLPKAQNLSTSSSVGFEVGQVVTGATSGAKGIVTAAGIGVEVVLTDTMIEFATSEKLVGPKNTVDITAVSDAASPAAVAEWDEALFTPLNGYPSCASIHRNRMLFSGHPRMPVALIGSRVDNLYDFDVGDGSDGDGFIETIGDAGAAQVRQLHSAEQLLVFTDKGPYYIPESAANPFRASGLAFYPFGSMWPCSAARTGAFDGGVIMVSGSLIVKCRPTGDATRMWDADEVSLLSPHLVNSPVDTAFTTNFGGGPERYGVFVNADGSLAVMQLVEQQKIRNFVPWNTDGSYKSAAALGGTLYAVVQRTIDGQTKYLLERFGDEFMLDASLTYWSLTDPGIASHFGDKTVHVVDAAGTYLGTLPEAREVPGVAPYTVGLNFDRRIQTLPPNIQDAQGNQVGEQMRIVKAFVHVQSSARFAANGYELTAYRATDDIAKPPPRHSGPIKFTFLGWRNEPTITITQPDPLPLLVLGISMEVAY